MKKVLYGHAKYAHLCYEKVTKWFLRLRFCGEQGEPLLVYSQDCDFKLYMDYFLFWERSQSDIDKYVKSYKADGHSYNWEQSKGESVSELLGIDTNAFDDGGFQFDQNLLIKKSWKPKVWIFIMSLKLPPRLRHILG